MPATERAIRRTMTEEKARSHAETVSPEGAGLAPQGGALRPSRQRCLPSHETRWVECEIGNSFINVA